MAEDIEFEFELDPKDVKGKFMVLEPSDQKGRVRGVVYSTAFPCGTPNPPVPPTKVWFQVTDLLQGDLTSKEEN